jgi:hypothetical protein
MVDFPPGIDESWVSKIYANGFDTMVVRARGRFAVQGLLGATQIMQTEPRRRVTRAERGADPVRPTRLGRV